MSKNKGTVRIHGKEYRTVARRVADFRASYAAKDGWAIASDIIELSDSHAVIKASIVNPEGRIVCSGLARDSAGDSSRHKHAFLEIAQTSAIGRALALFSPETMGEELEIASANEVQPAVLKDMSDKKLIEQLTKSLQALTGYAASMSTGCETSAESKGADLCASSEGLKEQVKEARALLRKQQTRPPAKEQPGLEVEQLKKQLREKYILFRDEFEDDLFEYVDRKLCESDNVEDLRRALKTAEYTERMTIEDKR